MPDDIYTHFERQETLATLHGKLDNELVRIHDILSRATAESIIVMNESFASTTVDDSVQIGTEVLERIIALGCVAVYVTSSTNCKSHRACVSMVAEVEHDDPTKRTLNSPAGRPTVSPTPLRWPTNTVSRVMCWCRGSANESPPVTSRRRL